MQQINKRSLSAVSTFELELLFSSLQSLYPAYNGRLTVLPVSTKRPVNPEDMNLTPQPEYISTEVVMDGRILEENLKRMGLDEKWLKKQLKDQGFKNTKDVFLAVCNQNNDISVYKTEK